MKGEKHNLVDFFNELLEISKRIGGKIPTVDDIRENHQLGICASVSTYHRRIGKEKDIQQFFLKRLTKEQLELKL